VASRGRGTRRSRAAAGRVIVYLDDDVRPPARWLEALCAPILAGTADAVAGGVRLAPHHRAAVDDDAASGVARLDRGDRSAGAVGDGERETWRSGRHVLERVAAFDVELGPGALGYGEDALFSQQLLRAGFTIVSAFDAAVEHHANPSRLTRAGFRDGRRAAVAGRSPIAAITGSTLDLPTPRAACGAAASASRSTRLAHPAPAPEGMPSWRCRSARTSRSCASTASSGVAPRNYDRRGGT
jgi:hypothetical protein